MLTILKQYQYPEKVISLTVKCYEELTSAIDSEADGPLFLAKARAWCGDHVNPSNQYRYTTAISQLEDVYQFGRIHGSHLNIYSQPSDYWNIILDQYDASMHAEYADYTCFRKNLDAKHFLCFLQCNGVQTSAEIDYQVLEKYCQYMEESSGGKNRRANVAIFLDYLAGQNLCHPGHPLYMHYVDARKIVTLSDLSDHARQVIEERRTESQLFPPEEFYSLIPDFIGQLEKARYCSTMRRDARFFLNLFYLFIDRENLGYDRTIVEIWMEEAVPLQCKPTGFVRGRHFYEMFEDYVNEGALLLGHRRMHQPTGYSQLPSWYKEQTDAFIDAKRKVGRKKKTLETYESPLVRFYRSLETMGIKSFDSITPMAVKEFHKTDEHSTIIGKNAYNSMIRQFLVFLELHHIVQDNLHFALPTCALRGESIVQVYSEEEMNLFHEFSDNACTARNQRDSAMLQLEEDTGMRPIDIAQLQIEDIDFEKLAVHFKQEKTQVPHELPIQVSTANAIYLYLRDLRPRGLNHHYVFVSVKAPHEPLSSALGTNTTIHVGVPKGGFAKFRKTGATELLRGGATLEEAARHLGHSNTNSLHRYVLLDEERMRLTPLSMEETGLSIDGRYKNG